MKVQKYHIGDNGPAPCRATSQRCRFEIEGTKEEMKAFWAGKLEEEHGGEQLLSGVSKGKPKESSVSANGEEAPSVISKEDLDPGFEGTRKLIGNELNYFPDPESNVSYDASERAVAMNVAAVSLEEGSYIAIAGKDEIWSSQEAQSDVQRLLLSDGSSGYFKSLQLNSLRESSFSNRGTNSLAGFTGEVNSFRMSQLMGDRFSKLVPKTEIRSFRGELGSFQSEVDESDDFYPDYEEYSGLVEDYRKAAIFDFVVGNLDRHRGNFLYGEQPDEFDGRRNRPAIRLIDNAMTFPDGTATINQSLFSRNYSTGEFHDTSDDLYKGLPRNEMDLKPDEIKSLNRARAGLLKWIEDGTMLKNNGDRAIARIDSMLKFESIGHLVMQLSARSI